MFLCLQYKQLLTEKYHIPSTLLCVCRGVIIHSIYIFSLTWDFMYTRILLYCWATFVCQFIMFGAYIFMSLSNMDFVYWLTISRKTSHQGQKSENKQTSKNHIVFFFLASPSYFWAVIFFLSFFCFP